MGIFTLLGFASFVSFIKQTLFEEGYQQYHNQNDPSSNGFCGLG
jgi:hypothetical protein